MNAQKGFSLVEGLLIILIVSVLGFAGYYVWNENRSENDDFTQNSQTETIETAAKDIQEPTEERYTIPDGWLTYTNEELGFSFSYPEKYGEIFETQRSDTEGQNSTLFVFEARNPCDSCVSISSPDEVNYFTLDMKSSGLFEMGATNTQWGGIGTSRPYAAGEGFDPSLANFKALNTNGYLTTAQDELHDQTTTRIEFNLSKTAVATGFEFMTNDSPGDTSNQDNLKAIAETFTTL